MQTNLGLESPGIKSSRVFQPFSKCLFLAKPEKQLFHCCIPKGGKSHLLQPLACAHPSHAPGTSSGPSSPWTCSSPGPGCSQGAQTANFKQALHLLRVIFKGTAGVLVLQHHLLHRSCCSRARLAELPHAGGTFNHPQNPRPLCSPPGLPFPSLPRASEFTAPSSLCLLRAAPGAQRRNESVNQSVSSTGGNGVCLPKKPLFQQWNSAKRGSTAPQQDLMWEAGWKQLRCHQGVTRMPPHPSSCCLSPRLPPPLWPPRKSSSNKDQEQTHTQKPPLGSPLAKHIFNTKISASPAFPALCSLEKALPEIHLFSSLLPLGQGFTISRIQKEKNYKLILIFLFFFFYSCPHIGVSHTQIIIPKNNKLQNRVIRSKLILINKLFSRAVGGLF